MSDGTGRMNKSVRLLAEQLAGIRPGAMSPGFIETFRVTSQGRSLSIRQVATVAHRGDRITISPFDRTAVAAIVRSLVEAKLNAYALDPATICVTIPPISGEQRTEFARHVKKLGEEAKIAVRSIRQEARKQIETRGRGSLRAVQEATDTAIAEIDRLVKAKIADLSS
ncbi:ribosome-recycling factor [Singulisphaera sp. Ch08]|uniref:Ribosome-recycling factor n=1 Tax=Singulisphaera sp. Ch08 TaxID=3120278 RepID=A0AAU7C7C5_9BACT